MSPRALLAAVVATAALLLLAAPAPAIVGGRPADRPFPAMGALERDGEFVCGASLVRPRVALTAAHCVEDTPAGALRVRFGITRRSDATGGDRVDVARVLVHESYGRPQDASHDVALLFLPRAPAAPAAPIRVVAADERALWRPGTVATTIGWGSTVFPSLLGGTDDLMQVEVPVRTDAECAGAYRGTFGWDATTMVCAGSGTGGRDSCQGDSGGPLMVLVGDEPVLVGTVSFGLGCGFPGFYGVYGRIGEPALAAWLVRNAGPVAGPSGAPAPAVVPASRVLGLRSARRRGRVLSLDLAVRRPVRALTVTVARRLPSGRTARVARTTRTTLAAGRVLRLRLPARGPRRALRITARATDDLGRVVTLRRDVRTTG